MKAEKPAAKVAKDLGNDIIKLSRLLYRPHRKVFLVTLSKTLQREITKLNNKEKEERSNAS